MKMKKSKKILFNAETKLLNKEENAKIFQLLGNGCMTKSTAITQLFKTEHPHHNEWIKQYSGVLCLVRDSNFKSYFLRLYCFESNTLLWEFNIPPGFKYIKSASFLHSFYGKDCVYGINFADEKEAAKFYVNIIEIVANIKIPKQKENVKKLKKQDTIKKSDKKSQRPIISNPVGFKHVQHYGFNDWMGLNTEIDKLSGKTCELPEATPLTFNQNVSPKKQIEQSYQIEIHEEIIQMPPKTTISFENKEKIPSPQPETIEKPSFSFMSELNSRFHPEQKNIHIEDEVKHESDNIQIDNGIESNEHKQFLKEAITTRQRAFYDDEDSDFENDDDDDDDWD